VVSRTGLQQGSELSTPLWEFRSARAFCRASTTRASPFYSLMGVSEHLDGRVEAIPLTAVNFLLPYGSFIRILSTGKFELLRTFLLPYGSFFPHG